MTSGTRSIWRVLAAVAAGSIFSTPAQAQRLELSMTPAAVTFQTGNPDTMPMLTSAPVQVTYRIRQNTGGWTLSVLALGDLHAGASTVDISNVTWMASPAPPFQNGTLSRTVAQPVATGTGIVNPARQGQLTFRLANSWLYDAGTYTQALVFTLTAP